MQKRNILGVERVINKHTKRIMSQEKGPTNTDVVSLAKLISALNRATKGSGTRGNTPPPNMSEEQTRAFYLEHGNPSFYDDLEDA
jgi:hypothetical protein